MRTISIAIFCLLVGSPAYSNDPVPSQESAPWRENARVTSHLKNFVVVDMPKNIALDVAIWAENVREQIQGWAEQSIPGKHAYPMIIGAVTRAEETQGFVIASQEVTGEGHLRQGITIVNRSLVDREDLLEALCRLLLNRWVYDQQSAAERIKNPGQLPDWFTCGVAQSMYPDLMDRNVRLILEEEEKGRYLPAISMAGRGVLPPGRWPEKAHAGLVINWLTDRAGGMKLLNRAAQLTAAGHIPDEAYLVEISGLPDRRAFNADWDLWMARISNRIVPGVTAGDTETLERILEMRADDFGLLHPAVLPGGNISPSLLIAERESKWARAISTMMHWRLRVESIGKLPEIQQAIHPFLEILEVILYPPEEETRRIGKREKVTQKPPSAKQLSRKWREADQQWQRVVEKTSGRKAFLDAHEEVDAATTNQVSNWLNQWQQQNP